MAERMLEEEEMLMDRAMTLEGIEDEAAAGLVGDVEFEVNELNQLVDALNLILPSFNMAAYPEFTEDLDGPLPAEFVRQLQMVADAATDAGMERLSFDVAEIEDAESLQDVAAKLDVLSKNEAFITFLRSERREAEEAVESPVEAEAEVVAEAVPEEDLEMMMAQRA